jgi:Cu/Ag efflux protein CusF
MPFTEVLMKFRNRPFAVVVFALGALGALAAQESKAPSESTVTRTATIEAIDKTSRLVTLKGEKGNVVVVKAGPEVKRFDELKVGDKVSATYYESVAVHVRKPGEPEPKAATGGIAAREGGPGGTMAAQETITVTVESIDPKAPSVTVKGPEGRVLSMRVRDPKKLEGIKAGDKVDVTYTQAFLLKVDPPK